MVNHLLVNTINKALGQAGYPTARGNYAYNCPRKNHRHAKLEVNCDDSSPYYGNFSCWGCGDFKGKTVIPLLKYIKAPQPLMNEARSILKVKSYNKIEEKNEDLLLPPEFKNFDSSLPSRHAMVYLKSRGITKEDIEKYNIGYCESGEYKNMIIIPSYDKDGILNYFMTRSFEKEPYRKTKNPKVSRNIIPFELFINWDLPIILCEGPFDALAIKRNTIPLLGKLISKEIMIKIVSSTIKKIYIALDKDALSRSLQLAEKFMSEDKVVYLVDLEDEDPSDLGFEKFTKLIQNTHPLTQYKLLEKKLNI